MDKKSLAILLVASSFVSSTFATSIVNKIIKKHSSANPSMVKMHKTTNKTTSYTDFSGTWMINCGDGEIESTVIENDANYISLDGVEFRIGQGLKSESDANEKFVRYDHTSFEWNENGSALTMKGVGASKDNTDNSTLETDIAKFTLTMKNGQINLDGTLTIFADVTQIDQPVTVHCVFSKKNNH